MESIIALTFISLLFVTFVIYHFIYVKEANKKHHELVKAIMAKNLREYDDSVLVENRSKTQKNDSIVTDIPEFMPADQVDDKTFQMHIDGLLGK